MSRRLLIHSASVLKFSLITFLFSISTQVLAQSGVLEEVIVTAQKREESLQDVGIAITAYSGEQLDAMRMNDSVAITAFTPGVHMSGNNAGHTQQFTIRGATQNDFFDLAEAPNAVYIDEGYQAAGQAQLFAQYDTERVEILKGPQGTLFGRNATGGLVHYITKKPTDEYEGYADVSYGRYDMVRFEGAVSGPLSDRVKARVSGFYRRHDSILENIFQSGDEAQNGFFPEFIGVPFTANGPARPVVTGSTSGQDDLWTDDQYSVRGQLLIEASDDMEILLKGSYAQAKPASGPYQNVATVGERDAQNRLVNTLFSNAQTNPNSCETLVVGTTTCWFDPNDPNGTLGEALDLDVTNLTRPLPNSDFFGYVDADGTDGLTTSTDHTVSDYDSVEIYGFTGKITWDLDFATFVAVANYSDQEKAQSLDVDSGPGPQLVVTNFSEIDWFTGELRLEGEADKARWILGFYYLTIDGTFAQCLCDTIGGINAFGALFFNTSDLFLDGSLDANLQTDSYSFFGQLDYDLTEQLTLSLGIRGIQEEKDYVYTSNFFVNTDDRTVESLRTGDTPLGSLLPDHTESTSDFLWSGKIGLDYAWSNDLLLYATINRGVKAGSCNAPLLTFLTSDQYCYLEEVLLAYEVGFKWTTWGGKARINASAYYYDYSDYQVFQFVGTSGAVFNADAEYKGFEVEMLTNPIENLDMIFGIAYIDPKVKDLNVAPNVPRDVEPSFTPEVQFNALGRYTWPNTLLGGTVAIQVDGNYASSAFHNINNFGTHKMDSYWRGNASLTWVSADEHWEVAGFVDNFSDTRNQNIGFELSTICGCDEQSFGYPRMYGVKLRYNYF